VLLARAVLVSLSSLLSKRLVSHLIMILRIDPDSD
jgi:hypothetical protein